MYFPFLFSIVDHPRSSSSPTHEVYHQWVLNSLRVKDIAVFTLSFSYIKLGERSYHSTGARLYGKASHWDDFASVLWMRSAKTYENVFWARYPLAKLDKILDRKTRRDVVKAKYVIVTMEFTKSQAYRI